MAYRNKYGSKTIVLINLILVEVFLVVLSSSWVSYLTEGLWNISGEFLSLFTTIASVLVGIISLFFLKEIIRLVEKEHEANINELMLIESNETVEMLRTHRHDFANHLQVMLGLLQLGKPDDALQYIREIKGEMRSEARVDNIENPVLAALFIKKRGYAERNGVNLSINMKSQLSNLSVKYAEFARIISNLLDNAILAATSQSFQGERKVEIDVLETQTEYRISVRNTGEPIPEDIRNSIFEKGFSTKNEKNHGFGLYIVRELVTKNLGKVEFTSNSVNGTIFRVTFPREG